MSIYYRKRVFWTGLVASGSAVLLVGCGPNEADQTPPTGDIATADVAPEPVETPAIDSDMKEGDKADAGAADKMDEKAGEQAASSASFPAKFQGRWAVNAADCAKARGMETTVMTIDGKSAQFYESMASLKSATVSGDVLTAKLGWAGEGQNWESATVFTLKDGGNTLTRVEADAAGALTYKKCPA